MDPETNNQKTDDPSSTDEPTPAPTDEPVTDSSLWGNSPWGRPLRDGLSSADLPCPPPRPLVEDDDAASAYANRHPGGFADVSSPGQRSRYDLGGLFDQTDDPDTFRRQALEEAMGRPAPDATDIARDKIVEQLKLLLGEDGAARLITQMVSEMTPPANADEDMDEGEPKLTNDQKLGIAISIIGGAVTGYLRRKTFRQLWAWFAPRLFPGSPAELSKLHASALSDVIFVSQGIRAISFDGKKMPGSKQAVLQQGSRLGLVLLVLAFSIVNKRKLDQLANG